MKIAIIYHPNSEHGRIVEDFARDFERQRGKKAELISLETKIGADMASLYGIVSYPAMIARREDNQLLKLWEGLPLPLMDEVSGYTD